MSSSPTQLFPGPGPDTRPPGTTPKNQAATNLLSPFDHLWQPGAIEGIVGQGQRGPTVEFLDGTEPRDRVGLPGPPGPAGTSRVRNAIPADRCFSGRGGGEW